MVESSGTIIAPESGRNYSVIFESLLLWGFSSPLIVFSLSFLLGKKSFTLYVYLTVDKPSVSDDHRYVFASEIIELFMFVTTYFTKWHSLTFPDLFWMRLNDPHFREYSHSSKNHFKKGLCVASLGLPTLGLPGQWKGVQAAVDYLWMLDANERTPFWALLGGVLGRCCIILIMRSCAST